MSQHLERVNALGRDLAACFERDAEILEDLEFALFEHGPGSEPWKMLVKELIEHEKRTAEIERQALLLVERRAQHREVSGMVDRIAAAWEWPA